MSKLQTNGVMLDLPDAHHKETPCVFIKKGSEIRRVLSRGYAATHGGRNGSVTVYRDVDDFYRGNVQVWCIERETMACEELADIVKWFDEKYKEAQ